jgi:hypothetical protein
MALPPDERDTGMPLDQARSISGFKPIDVDIKSLSDFANALQQEVETNLRPAWNKILPTLDKGSQFAFTDELGLGDKRSTYDRYLQMAKIFFRDVAEGTRQLSEAAAQIGANYDKADQFSKVQVGDVEKALPKVPQPSTTTQPSTGGPKPI